MELQFKGYKIYLDVDDCHLLDKYKFYISDYKFNKYLKSTKSYNNIFLHRLIMNFPENKEIDHINGNGLDNRKCNLRIVNSSQNKMNRNKGLNTSSKYKGTCWDKSRNKWISHIAINGKSKFLGRFNDEREAAKAYNYMALKHFGEYANINQFN